MFELDVWVLLSDFGDDVLPELESFQHVRFVYAGDFFIALACRLERNVRNTLNFWAAVAHGVEGFLGAGEVTVGCRAPPTRLTKIDVTGQFSNNQDVQSGHQLGLEAGGINQLRVANGRAEVGKQSEVLAQT